MLTDILKKGLSAGVKVARHLYEHKQVVCIVTGTAMTVVGGAKIISEVPDTLDEMLSTYNASVDEPEELEIKDIPAKFIETFGVEEFIKLCIRKHKWNLLNIILGLLGTGAGVILGERKINRLTTAIQGLTLSYQELSKDIDEIATDEQKEELKKRAEDRKKVPTCEAIHFPNTVWGWQEEGTGIEFYGSEEDIKKGLADAYVECRDGCCNYMDVREVFDCIAFHSKLPIDWNRQDPKGKWQKMGFNIRLNGSPEMRITNDVVYTKENIPLRVCSFWKSPSQDFYKV